MRARPLRLAALGALLLAGALIGIQAVRAARSELWSFRPRRGPVARPPSLDGVRSMRDVSFEAGGVALRGWHVPSRNRAAVILTHGSGADRTALSGEIRLLADAGFGVLAFDWPGHGESGGRVTYGKSEVEAFRAAVTFVASQGDVESARIGALGVSIGAALLAVAATQDRRVRALVLVSPFTDADDLTRAQYARWGPITQWPALWIDHAHMPDGNLRPVDAVRALDGCPLLVVVNGDDDVVPPSMSKEVFAAAPPPKDLLIVPDARHGGEGDPGSAAYRERLVRFFGDSLLARISRAPDP